MTKRSLLKLFIYSVLTLGIYELVWLGKTRREMIDQDEATIPPVAYMVIARIACLVTLVLIAHVTISFAADKSHSVSISSECSSERTLSQASQTSAFYTLSSDCKDQIAASDAYNAQLSKKIKELFVILAVGMLYIYTSNKWLAYYASAAENATSGLLSAKSATLALVFLPFAVGMMIVQNSFNKSVPLEEVPDNNVSGVIT